MTMHHKGWSAVARIFPRVFTSALVSALGGLVGCSSLTGGDQQLPSGTSNPANFHTLQGARDMHNAALVSFAVAVQRDIIETGLLTDELDDPATGLSPGRITTGVVSAPLDERIIPEGASLPVGSTGATTYGALQAARGEANQAIGALATYGADAPSAVRGELYAIQGYTEVLLADFFCSGVPLSTLDFSGDYTYHASSTTQQVYANAIAKFDTAITLAGDSARILNLARVGKGRALLALDSVTAAAQVVSAVPDNFTYSLGVQWTLSSSSFLNDAATVADHEGINGLSYRSSGDPRTAVIVGVPAANGALARFFPAKYTAGLSTTTYAPLIIASGVEARLIEAEAALRTNHSNGQWLAILNALRTTCTTAANCPAPAPAGIGGVAGLAPLDDPGTDTARLTLLFTERAAWFFLDSHRQGDLRRLVRNYQRPQDAVYPTGLYLAPGMGRYGSDVNAPIPSDEAPNSLFHGCLDRNA